MGGVIMKLVENEIVVYDLYSKQIIMHFDYSTEQYTKLLEIANNMNECLKLNNITNVYYLVTTIYGVMYEDNKNAN